MLIRNTNRHTQKVVVKATALVLAGLLSSVVVALPVHSQSPATPAAKPAQTGRPTHYQPNRFPKQAEAYYGGVWGLDSLTVKAVESGALLRFSYRILDPAKAKIMNDKKFDAFLDAPGRNVRLSIPS